MEKTIIGLPTLNGNSNKAQLEERLNLICAFEKAGIPFIKTSVEWPRDLFINFFGKVYTRGKYGLYADAGYIIPTPSITLVCSEVSVNENEQRDSPEERYKKLSGLYGKVQILPPPERRLNKFISPHLDLVLLPIPEKEILFVDRTYYQKNKEEVDTATERCGLKVETVGQDYNSPSWPCNTYLVNNGQEIIAFTNSEGNSQFIRRLSQLGIKVFGVPFSRNCAIGGSIKCATNSIPQRQA